MTQIARQDGSLAIRSGPPRVSEEIVSIDRSRNHEVKRGHLISDDSHRRLRTGSKYMVGRTDSTKSGHRYGIFLDRLLLSCHT